MADDPDKSVGTVVIRFVLPKGKNETTCSDELSEAFEKCREQDMNPSWITTNEALDLNCVKTDVFVLDPFEGIHFESIIRPVPYRTLHNLMA